MANATSASIAAQRQAAPKGQVLVIYYYGDGKGKTTAALGLALRASAYKKKILFAQFVKGDWGTGEDVALAKIDNIEHKKFGVGFVYESDSPKRMKAHIDSARKGLEFVRQNHRRYDIIVLDEISNAIKLDLLNAIDVYKIVVEIKKRRTIILTGSPRIKELIELSDLITEMKKIAHPFDKGITAVESIDW